MGDLPKKLKVDFSILAAATLVCFCIVGFRIVIAGRTGYLFLAWNLFLAWLPLLFADAAELFHRHRHTVRFWISSFLWLIFFPNAPYIVTDFKHLLQRFSVLNLAVPWWFDFAMIGAFALTGIVLGLCSLQVMKTIALERLGAFWSWFGMVAVSLLAGFGIYLGRYLRWNSWDVLLNPGELLKDIAVRLTDPLAHPETWLISFLFAALVLFSHVVFTAFFRYSRKKMPSGVFPKTQ